MITDSALIAADSADWQQVVLNGGPPCFHVHDGTFCLRAKAWEGHDVAHRYVSLRDVIEDARHEGFDDGYSEGYDNGCDNSTTEYP